MIDAAAWARVALDVVNTTYPYGSGHTSLSERDTDVTPPLLHPAFHGALDWHSSAHMQWSLVQLLTVAKGDLDTAGLTEPVCSLLDRRLTRENIATEVAYLRTHPGYERPYGWAWAAMLTNATTHYSAGQAADSGLTERAARWADACSDLGSAVGDALLTFVPKLSYPVRHGVHSNTALAMSLCLQAFGGLERFDVVAAIEARAQLWFASDRDADTRTEPSGTDFLSPVLCEADLMRQVLSPAEFSRWFAAYLPDLGGTSAAGRGADRLLHVPAVSDQTDGQLAHLHGLSLSRAWQLANLARTLPMESPRRAHLLSAAHHQYEATRPVVVAGHFMATHWLVTFALLAATALQDTTNR